MLLVNPFCPISAAKIAGLKTTVVLLLVLLMVVFVDAVVEFNISYIQLLL